MVRHHLTIFLSLYLFNGALGDDQGCIAPVMPDLGHCAVCSDVRSNQCVTEGRWFSCFASIEECCSDWSIQNVQSDTAACIADSLAAIENPDDSADEWANELMSQVPKVTHSVCEQMVSVRPDVTTNAGCMTECDWLLSSTGGGKSSPFDDAEFAKHCVQAHWEAVNGRTQVDDCFDKFIYGYSQESKLASIVQNLTTETPAQCQLLCQIDDDCVNWAWVSDLYASTEQNMEHICLLKSEEQVEKALEIHTDILNPPNMDSQFCNVRLPELCLSDHYNCLPCGSGDKRCVWESDMHVTGWKYCTPVDKCSPDYDFEATQPPVFHSETAATDAPPSTTPTHAPTPQITTIPSTAPTPEVTVLATKAAVSTTKAAEVTTKAAEATTKAAEATTKAAVATTKVASATTKAPATTTKAPATTTKAPVTTTKAPSHTTKPHPPPTKTEKPHPPPTKTEKPHPPPTKTEKPHPPPTEKPHPPPSTTPPPPPCTEEESDSDSFSCNEDSVSDDECRPSCHHKKKHHRHHHHRRRRHHRRAKCSGDWCDDGVEIRVADRPKKLELSIEN